jgi:hypothetical protein
MLQAIDRVPGVIVRVCRHRIRIKVLQAGKQRLVNVDPENVLYDIEQNDVLQNG